MELPQEPPVAGEVDEHGVSRRVECVDLVVGQLGRRAAAPMGRGPTPRAGVFFDLAADA